MNLSELKRKKMTELIHMGSELGIEGVSGMRRQDLIFALLQHHSANRGEVYGDGVLETLPDGFGFLRSPDYNYLPAPTTSMSRLRRSGVSACVRVTRSKARSGRPRIQSGTSRSSRLNASMARRPMRCARRSCSTT